MAINKNPASKVIVARVADCSQENFELSEQVSISNTEELMLTADTLGLQINQPLDSDDVEWVELSVFTKDNQGISLKGQYRHPYYKLSSYYKKYQQHKQKANPKTVDISGSSYLEKAITGELDAKENLLLATFKGKFKQLSGKTMHILANKLNQEKSPTKPVQNLKTRAFSPRLELSSNEIVNLAKLEEIMAYTKAMRKQAESDTPDDELETAGKARAFMLERLTQTANEPKFAGTREILIEVEQHFSFSEKELKTASAKATEALAVAKSPAVCAEDKMDYQIQLLEEIVVTAADVNVSSNRTKRRTNTGVLQEFPMYCFATKKMLSIPREELERIGEFIPVYKPGMSLLAEVDIYLDEERHQLPDLNKLFLVNLNTQRNSWGLLEAKYLDSISTGYKVVAQSGDEWNVEENQKDFISLLTETPTKLPAREMRAFSAKAGKPHDLFVEAHTCLLVESTSGYLKRIKEESPKEHEKIQSILKDICKSEDCESHNFVVLNVNAYKKIYQGKKIRRLFTASYLNKQKKKEFIFVSKSALFCAGVDIKYKEEIEFQTKLLSFYKKCESMPREFWSFEQRVAKISTDMDAARRQGIYVKIRNSMVSVLPEIKNIIEIVNQSKTMVADIFQTLTVFKQECNSIELPYDSEINSYLENKMTEIQRYFMLSANKFYGVVLEHSNLLLSLCDNYKAIRSLIIRLNEETLDLFNNADALIAKYTQDALSFQTPASIKAKDSLINISTATAEEYLLSAADMERWRQFDFNLLRLTTRLAKLENQLGLAHRVDLTDKDKTNLGLEVKKDAQESP